MEVIVELRKLHNKKFHLKKITRDNLDVDYGKILPEQTSKLLFESLENDIIYELAENSMLKIFGKMHKIPRQQTAYGDEGTNYHFSGKTTAAKPWLPTLLAIRDLLFNITNFKFNFVLVNRYANGLDHIGEHRDNEPDLDKNAPIASLSLGQSRDFIFKHRNARLKGPDKQNIPTVKILLENGSLLVMNCPTNKFWYHSLPIRKNANNIRINLTFRCIKNKR